jgi:hypothetical protein
MKGFAWRQCSPGRWSRRRHSSLILAALMRYRRPASDETQGSSSVEVSECSDVDKRAQSVGTAHGARGDSFTAEAVLREKGGGPRCRGARRGGFGGAGATRGGGAPDGWHDAGAMEAVSGRANRGGQRKGGLE